MAGHSTTHGHRLSTFLHKSNGDTVHTSHTSKVDFEIKSVSCGQTIAGDGELESGAQRMASDDQREMVSKRWQAMASE